jgi:hypothetical protein
MIRGGEVQEFIGHLGGAGQEPFPGKLSREFKREAEAKGAAIISSGIGCVLTHRSFLGCVTLSLTHSTSSKKFLNDRAQPVGGQLSF